MQDAVQYTLAMMESPQQPRVSDMFDSTLDTDSPPAYESLAAGPSLEHILATSSNGAAAVNLPAVNCSPFDASAFGGLVSTTPGSPQRIRLLNFNVEYRGLNIPIVLQDTNSVGMYAAVLSIVSLTGT
jgi:hypothetical protein